MDKVSKIGLIISIILLIVWFYWQREQAKKISPTPELEEETISEAEKIAYRNSIIQPDVTPILIEEEKELEIKAVERPVEFPPSSSIVRIDTDFLTVEFNCFGGVIQKLILKENSEAGIRKLPEEKSGDITLFSVSDVDKAPGQILNFEQKIMEVKQHKNTVEFNYQYENNMTIFKKYSFNESKYTAILNIVMENKSNKNVYLKDGLVLSCGAICPIDKDDLLAIDVLPVGGKIIRKKEEVLKSDLKIYWLGLKTKYFTAIFKPEIKSASFFRIEGRKKIKETSKAIIGCRPGEVASPYEYLKAVIGFDSITLKPGEKVEYSFICYFGPANYEILKKSGNDFEQIVDLGFLRPICVGIIWLLGKIYGLIGSFGWSIIILTVIIKVVLWPLTHKSYKSMKEMQKLQPEIAALKEKLKSDPKKVQAETMKLYKQHGVNPMGGCLPMLLQMPILFALFTTLRNTILLRKAPFWIIPGTWIKDLSGPDVLKTLSQSYPIIGNQLNILPLLMGLSFFLQQKFTPTSATANPQAAQQQKMMSTMMPILFTFIFYTLPAGLNLYFMLSTFITVAQQVIITKKD